MDPLLLTFEIAALATVLAGAVGGALAGLLANARFPGRELVDTITTAPMVMPPTVLGYYLLVALGRSSVVGRAWEAATGSPVAFTRTGAVVAAFVGALPLVVKNARAALEQVDGTLVLAARTLGATPLRAFFTVQLPLASRGVIAALMLAFARSTGDFGATLMLAGDIPGETRTAAIAIFDLFQAGRMEEATRLAVVLTAIVAALLLGVSRLTRR